MSAPGAPSKAPAKADLAAPRVAWPTVVLALAAAATWAGAVALGAAGRLPLPLAVGLAAAAAFACFTPMHDAAHRSVARARWLNELVGRLAAVPLTAPFVAFRYVHLEHHKHTNAPGLDPDLWSGTGPRALLPLRWLTQDLHYYAVVFAAARRRPRAELVELALALGAQAAVLALCWGQGLLLEAALLWLLPARLAIAALAWSFDYAPHRPHVTRASDDRFRATHVVGGPWLTLPFLWQNYHLIHHLYPGVPFYRYARLWRAQRADLLARGARVVPVVGRVLPLAPAPAPAPAAGPAAA